MTTTQIHQNPTKFATKMSQKPTKKQPRVKIK